MSSSPHHCHHVTLTPPFPLPGSSPGQRTELSPCHQHHVTVTASPSLCHPVPDVPLIPPTRVPVSPSPCPCITITTSPRHHHCHHHHVTLTASPCPQGSSLSPFSACHHVTGSPRPPSPPPMSPLELWLLRTATVSLRHRVTASPSPETPPSPPPWCHPLWWCHRHQPRGG